MDVTQRAAHSQILKRLPERLWPWRRRTANESTDLAPAWTARFAPTSSTLHAEACAEERRQRQLLETLVAGLSHRVNNGLHGILAHADCLARTATPSQAASAQGVAASAQGLAELTRLLARAACEVPTAPAAHDLTKLVNAWRLPLQELCPAALALSMESATEAVQVSVDPARLWEALGHVLRNAVEAYAGQAGSIHVRVGTWSGPERLLGAARPVVNIRGGSYGYVEVNDHGQGMDDAQLARVFDPFFSTRFIGRGLGLPVVVNLMRCMGGLVLLDSAKGEGTRVRLLLPLVQAHETDPRDHTGVLRNGRSGAPAASGPATA